MKEVELPVEIIHFDPVKRVIVKPDFDWLVFDYCDPNFMDTGYVSTPYFPKDL